MKLTRSQLKELIRQSIRELRFKDQDAFDAYNKKHKMRKTTKVTVGDKETTAGKASSKGAEPDMDAGGPSYSNVPKGAKSTKQAKLMKKNDEVAKELGFSDQDDVFMASISDIDDYVENVPDEGQDWDQALELLNLLRDHEQGVKEMPEDSYEEYLAQVKKLINTPGKKGSGKSAKDTEADMMKASDAANAKMDKENPDRKAKLDKAYKKADQLKKELSALYDKNTGIGSSPEMKKKQAEIKKYWADVIHPLEKSKDDNSGMKNQNDAKAKKAKKAKAVDSLNKQAQEGKNQLIDTERYGMVSWEQGEPDEDSFFAIDQDGESIELDYDEIVRFHNPDEVDVKGLTGESINLVREFKGRRATVKEVRKWMRGLEENRYKKTYMADCRRVSWLVNNSLSEDYESMPKSMRKKWSKAAYGRERQLAREFIKSRESKVNEIALRDKIRNKVLRLIK